MVSLELLTEKLNIKLNTLIEGVEGVKEIKIYLDGGKYEKPFLEQNVVENDFIQGVSMLNSSSIVPINGILIQTFNVATEIAVPIDTDLMAVNKEDGSITMTEKAYNDSIEPYRIALERLASQTYVESVTEENKTYVVSYTVSTPRSGRITQRDGLGFSISLSFVIEYAIVQNGINSRDVILEFEGEELEVEEVPFTQLTFVRSPVMDSGAFSGTNGNAKNYMAVSAMQISISVPALSDSIITREHFDFLLTGIPKIYNVSITLPGKTKQTYQMHFGDCNIAVRELDNVGQSITLVEALEL
jgi:hypothetical protein